MKKKCWFVFMLILFVSYGFISSAAEVPKKAIKLVEKGDEALQKNEYDKALEAYDKAIELAPEYASAYFGKGRLLLIQKNSEEAIKNLEKAVELDPEALEPKKFLAQNLFQLGVDAFRQRQLNQSNNYFSKLLSIPAIDTAAPEIAQKALFQIGTNYYSLRNNEESNKYYLKLLSFPGIETADKTMLIQATYQVGANYSAQKEYKKALEFFLKVLDYPELQTDNNALYISVLYMTGLNATFADEVAKGIEYLGKFLEAAKESPQHSQIVPHANLLMGSSEMTILQKEVEKLDDKDKVAKVAELAKSKPEIETYLTKAIELKPDMEEAYMHLGNYYYFCNNLEKAITTYKTLIEKFPSSTYLDQYKKFLADIEKEGQKDKK